MAAPQILQAVNGQALADGGAAGDAIMITAMKVCLSVCGGMSKSVHVVNRGRIEQPLHAKCSGLMQ